MIAYYGLAAISLLIASGLSGYAAIWPSSGILLAGLIRHPRHGRALVSLCFLASLAANAGAGHGLAPAVTNAIADIAAPVVAYQLLKRFGLTNYTFTDIDAAWWVGLTIIVASAGSAAAASALAGAWQWQHLFSWFATHALGLAIVTPLTLVATELAVKHAAVPRTEMISGLAIGALVLTVSTLVFAQSTVPLLYLPSAVVMVAAYRLRLLGATAGLLTVAMLGSGFSSLGRSSIHLVAQNQFAGVVYFQIYLVVMLALALWIAIVATQQQRLHRRVTKGYALLELAEETAHVGHWRLRLSDNDVYWSKEVFRIHGMPPSESPPLDTALEAYHPDDRAIVEQSLARTIETGAPFDFEARLFRVNGTMRHVASHGQLQRNAHGEAIALFGTIKDVTERVEAAQALDEARRAAEHAMRRAVEQAETDELTGLHNRRSLLAQLERSARSATVDTPLSVAMLDIDHFKSINDTYGHATGDTVLRRVATTIRACIRDTDFVGRIGGEEFVVLLPGSPAGAAAVADRIRRRIEESAANASGPAVTVSIGLATTCSDERTATVLLQQADRALYDSRKPVAIA